MTSGWSAASRSAVAQCVVAVRTQRAGHDEGVHPVADLVERQVDADPDAGARPHLAAVRPGQQHLVRGAGQLPGRQREHFGGPGDVEEIDAGEHGDDDTVRSWHAPIVRNAPP